ncbi:MAG: DNA translocase FtsK [Gaiella sp.]
MAGKRKRASSQRPAAATKRGGRSRPSPRASPRPRTPRQRTHHYPELWGLALAVVGLFTAAVLWFGWDGGPVGTRVAGWLEDAVGAGAYALPLVLVAIGGLMLVRSALVTLSPFRVGTAVALAGLLVTLGGSHGGFLGQITGGALAEVIGGGGAVLVGVALLLAGALLVTGASAGAVLRGSGAVMLRAGSAARRSFDAFDWGADAHVVEDDAVAEPVPSARRRRGKPVDGAEAFPDVMAVSAEQPQLNTEPPPLLGFDATEADTDETGLERSLFPSAAKPGGDYTLPDRKLLKTAPPVRGDATEVTKRTAETLVTTLDHFGVEANIVGTIAGPRVVRYELQLAPGTKVSKVAALKDDLSYALATTEIRILAPIPGKQAVGVEVPNLAPKLVTLGDIFDDLPGAASPLSVWIGKDISGNSVWTDLARMPHLLIAGTTGSGKSGCINTILTSILLRATPDEARLILIDPKRIELNYYESIPHLLTPVVSSPKEASAVLQNVVAEMERRYERLSLVRARNLSEANRAFKARGEDPLPYLLVVIDELADLMMVSPQAVEDAVIRLAQKSRAVGIHLVLATQRPSVDVITGMIKANVPSRIAFAVSSQTDSRVILDTAGAESLLGQGDMLFKPLGTSRLQRVQGAYVTEEEIALIVEQCRAQRGQELDESLLEMPEGAPAADDGEDPDFDPDEDPLLDRAIEIVVQTQTASVSLIQRRLRVGYTRAGRLIDMLERRGIISGYEGSKPRRVLVEEHQLASIIGPG